MVILINNDDFSMESQDRLTYHLIIIKGSFSVKNLLNVRSEIANILELGVNNMIFDLNECTELDSSAIGIMTNLYKKLTIQKGSVGILRPQQRIEGILTETGLSRIMPIFDNIDEVDSEFE